jgi:hypothetical protein
MRIAGWPDALRAITSAWRKQYGGPAVTVLTGGERPSWPLRSAALACAADLRCRLARLPPGPEAATWLPLTAVGCSIWHGSGAPSWRLCVLASSQTSVPGWPAASALHGRRWPECARTLKCSGVPVSAAGSPVNVRRPAPGAQISHSRVSSVRRPAPGAQISHSRVSSDR